MSKQAEMPATSQGEASRMRPRSVDHGPPTNRGAWNPAFWHGVNCRPVAEAPRSAPFYPLLGLRSRGLTSQESEVAIRVAEGQSNERIARTLMLSVGTVKHRLAATMGKLECVNRVQVATIVGTLVGREAETQNRAIRALRSTERNRAHQITRESVSDIPA